MAPTVGGFVVFAAHRRFDPLPRRANGDITDVVPACRAPSPSAAFYRRAGFASAGESLLSLDPSGVAVPE